MAKLYGALFTLSMIWGTSFLFVKLLLEDFGSWGVVFLRCLFGALTLVAITFVKREAKQWRRLPWKAIIVVALLNNAIPWGLIALSETQISSSLASVVNATTPIWTSLIGFAMFSSRMHKMQWIGIVVGFIGILVLLDLDVAGLFTENFIGIGTMIGAAICYGLGSQLSKRNLSNLSVTMISASTLSVATVVSFIMSMLTEPVQVQAVLEWNNLLSVIGIGVFGSGFAYLFYYYMIKEGSAEFASLVTYLVPVSALIWGALLLDEAISVHMILGLVLIFSGVYLSSRKSKAATARTPAINKQA
ncbi:EamA family transporter [Bacillus tianshenii]|nr:EamA family transporter [Bacillus tianshenii]